MLANTTLWVLVGLLIFLGILWKYNVHTMILNALDQRGRKIAEDLAEAARLRSDAERLLAEFETRRKAAEAEAEAIVAAARSEAERLAQDADAKLADFVTRRTRAAEMKIAQAEAQAVQDVRAASAEAAARAAEIVLRAQAGTPVAGTWLDRGLSEVKSQLN